MYSVTKDFLGKPAPPGYVAGLGRGATGFTTRSDIGPAREASTASDKLPSRTPQPTDQDDPRFHDTENEIGLFRNAPYEADDEEADKIWASIDTKMELRHAARHQKQESTKSSDQKPVIEEHFKDLKRQLQDLSEADWEEIPDAAQVAETAARAKRRRKQAGDRRGERFTQVSDSVMMAGLNAAGFEQNLGVTDMSAEDGTVTNFMAIGQARDDVLRMKLDQAGDSATGQTTVDPRGYFKGTDTAQVSDDD
ncbi:U4/U6 x U5 tri-snRNP complex subunit Prp1 [Linderina macrospora]|uniref:U4/U6 x U5 tri-snRNP complex subunit Prp1 n=1 Tax=Linderina macrospora TaxID=4868 RepID=A0ACC1JHW5_9FUNG|nr:U4/U6 x U5 tri-snRNP complex subunit Prp1 [Linderina macrospora]